MTQDTQTSETPLNDVMIAMDVVDTLRHDEASALRELNSDARRADLIERLREIYKGQGIEVPDRILEEGVKALEEKRFVYDPPPQGWRRTLAEFYVTRTRWGKWAIGGLAGMAAVILGWQLLVEQPRRSQEAAVKKELSQTLPAQLKADLSAIHKLTQGDEVKNQAERLAEDGQESARAGKLADARAKQKQLASLLEKLKQTFKIKIVQRRGELSGLWRVPKINPRTRNYYLIVEAIDSEGRALKQIVVNEETGDRKIVRKWGVRVPRAVLERVQADKADDGIIQNAIVGEKRRGELEPHWFIDIRDGTLTQW